MIGGKAFLRLAGDVRFQRYGEAVYLRAIDARKDYLFSSVAGDILDCVAGGEARTEEEVLSALLERYEVEDETAFRREVGGFLDQLRAEGILEPGPDGPPGPGGVQDRVSEICAREHRLFSAALELTGRCSERCVHCYVDGPERETGDGELTLAEYRDLLDQLRAMGCLSVLLTGGEVFMREDFLDIARYASSLGMLVDVFTNGIALTPERFDALRALRPNSVSYSLYGGSARIHDAVTGVEGSFQRTLNAVMMTKCAGIDTYIKTVVMKQNLDSLEELLQWGRRLDVPVAAGFAVLDSRMGRSGWAFQLEEPEEFRRGLALLDQYKPARPALRGRRVDSPVCSAGKSSLSIGPRGEVRPCMTMPVLLGNVRETPIAEIWERAPALEALKKVTMGDVCEACGSCQYFDFCELCLGRVRSGGGIPRDVCLLAEASAQAAEQKGGKP